MNIEHLEMLLAGMGQSVGTLVLAALLFALMSFVAFYGIFRVRSIYREQRLLQEAIRTYSRSGSAPSRVHFCNEQLQAIWRAVLLLGSKAKAVEHFQENFKQAIWASAQLVGSADAEESAAEALLDIVAKKVGSEVISAAVVLRSDDRQGAGLRVLRSIGLPSGRAEQVLLMCFDSLYDPLSDFQQSRWGYRSAADGSCYDFSVFGVGLSLFVPLVGQQEKTGGVWLGFKLGAGSLSALKRDFIKVVAEHAAASFHAASRAQARSAKSENERDMLLGISHDMRAPGNRALCLVRDLLSEELGEISNQQRVQLEAVEKAVEDQMSLVGDALDFARHKKGLLEARPGCVDLGQEMLRVAEDYRIDALARDVELDISEITNIFLQADLRHFRRIFANLLSNSVKYTDSGEIKVSCRSVNEFIEIEVSDTGIGISPEERGLLFQEFSRAPGAKGREGIGLGLALAKALAELNGGYVFYRPQPEKGSVFGFGLKQWKLGNLPTEVSLPRVPLLLIVDDDPAACRTITRFMRDLAEVIVPAHSLSEAIDLANSMSPALVITDLNLGDGEGFELLDILPENIPALLVTGARESFVDKRISKRLRTGILEKPVTRELLLRAVTGLYASSTFQSVGSNQEELPTANLKVSLG